MTEDVPGNDQREDTGETPRVVRPRRRAQQEQQSPQIRNDGEGGPAEDDGYFSRRSATSGYSEVSDDSTGYIDDEYIDDYDDDDESAADEPDYVLLPRDTSAGRKVITVFFGLFLIVGVLLGGTLLWATRQVDPSGPQGAVVEKLTIPKGASVATISQILADKGIIANRRVFTMYVGLKNTGAWKAGNYVDFRLNSSFDEAIAVLDKGPIAPASKVVRIVEGSRLVDALEAIAEQTSTVTVAQLQEALDSGQVRSAYKPDGVGSWEGLLFPDTYEFAEDDTAAVILQKMVSKMDTVLDSLGYDRANALSGRSAYELITIASLVERETGQPADERGKISRVISNRLDDGERLEIDASVLYGLGRRNGSLTKSDLETDTPYNTRKIKGLPPTPISLPGEASLKAAIEPTPGDWKFYVLVSNDPPSHFFTSSYKEFLKQKADAQKRGVF